VCEYVFQNGAIPINPFRAFDYFLGDRVERNLIREGNRRLLDVSDEVWVFGEQLADGVVIEIAQAIRTQKPVRYFSIDNRADSIHEVQASGLDFELEVLHVSGMQRPEALEHITNGRAEFLVEAFGRFREIHGAL
jgi:hypothetical protein